MEQITTIVGWVIYGILFLIALWGAYCIVMAWLRVGQKRFRNEEAQLEFLQALEAPLTQRDFASAMMVCEGDRRALCQLAHLALENRKSGYNKVRQMVLDRFQRDILADLEHRLSWVNTVVKAAPMIGLLGTVIGMMGAFGTLASAEKVEATLLADDINVALRTTACGLAIAIPLVIGTASINVRIRKLEDLVEAGLTRFFGTFRDAVHKKD